MGGFNRFDANFDRGDWGVAPGSARETVPISSTAEGVIQTDEGKWIMVKRPTDWADVVRMQTGQLIGFYREFSTGWMRGPEWVCASFSEKAQEYTIWKGCENQSPFDTIVGPVGHWNPERVASLFERYVRVGAKHSRVEVIELAKSKDLQKLIPMQLVEMRRDGGQILRNIHGDFNGWVKLREGLDVTPRDILLTTNLELRRSLMDVIGAENFMLMVKHEIIDVRHMRSEIATPNIGIVDGKVDESSTVVSEEWDDYLVRFNVRDSGVQLTMLFVKDSSTPRRYLIRVPQDALSARLRDGRIVAPKWTVDAAVAWTFDMTLEQYKPVKET